MQCGSPPQPGPAPKRRKVTHLHEDPLTLPPVEPSNDELSSALQDAVRDNWAAIRTHVVNGPVQARYNIRLMTSDIGGLELGHIFAAQTTAFKINISYVLFFEIEHRIDTDIIIALVTAAVDTSTNLV